MYLYHISQSVNKGWDTYDSAVVCAASAEDARQIHPGGEKDSTCWYYTWCGDPKEVQVRLIGTANSDIAAGVVCASFNAG